MRAVLFLFAIGAWMAWRRWKTLGPKISRVLSWGDDIGGWAIAFHLGGKHAGGLATRGAKLLLALAAVVMFAAGGPKTRLALLSVAVWQVAGVVRRRAAAEREFSSSGFSSKAERAMFAKAMPQTLLAMGLGSRGAEPQPPHVSGWRKQPVRVGGKVVEGQFVYSCLVRPAGGKAAASIMDVCARGLDSLEDPLRDNLNHTLRAVGGAQGRKLRKDGMVPTIVLTTAEPGRNRAGELIGVVRVNLWTTDPFRRPVAYPYNPAKPVVRKFTDPVPVGLLRSNGVATMQLDASTSIQGVNGSGKSSIARPALIAAAHTDALIICIALKGPADYIDLAPRFVGGLVITEPAEARKALRWVEAEVRRRNRLTAAERSKLPHLLVIIDEGQELADDLNLAVMPAKLGRSAKTWLWVITQYGLAAVVPPLLRAELKQKAAGRIDGLANQAQVTVGPRAHKGAGPHLIPAGKIWSGVLFDDLGRYIRAFWVSCDSEPGKPSQLAVCAKACGPRPDDPEGFVEALAAAEPTFASKVAARLAGATTDVDDEASDDAAVAWKEDGIRRAGNGEVVSLDISDTSLLDPAVTDAARLIVSSIRPQHVTVTVRAIRKALDGIDFDSVEQEVADAARLLLEVIDPDQSALTTSNTY